MAPKKKLSEDELTSIKERALAAADMPVMDMVFDDAELSINWDTLPPMSAPASAKAAGTAGGAVNTTPLSGTHPINIRIEARVLRAFKAEADKTGGSYQALMNRALRAAAAGFL